MEQFAHPLIYHITYIVFNLYSNLIQIREI
jgi:hypothetical protein